MFSVCGVEAVPEYLNGELTCSINEVQVSKELGESLEEFTKKFEAIVKSKDQKIEL